MIPPAAIAALTGGSAAASGAGFLSSAGGFGSLLSGIGSIGSGFGLGSKSKSPSGKDYYKSQYFNMAAKHNFAKQFGYHPMYLMGAPSISPAASTAAGGPDYQAIGAGIEKIAGAPAQKAMAALGLRQAESETQLSELQVEAQRLQIEKMRQEINAGQDKGGAAVHPYGSNPADPLEIVDYEGNKWKVKRPGMMEQVSKEYPGWEEIEGILAGLQDRGLPAFKQELMRRLDLDLQQATELGRWFLNLFNSRDGKTGGSY